MVKKKGLLLIFLIVFLINNSIARQNNVLHSQSKKAIKLYDESAALMAKRNFEEAVDVLQKAVKTDPEFAEAHYRLGFIYMMDNKTKQAKPHFEKVVSIMPDNKSIRDAYLSLAEIYFSEESYEESGKAADKYLQLQPGSKGNIYKAERLKASAVFAIDAIKHPLDFKPKAMPEAVNGFQRQYFPVLTADQQTLIFTVKENQKSGEDIYISTKLNGQWQRPQSISRKLNTEFNEGTCTISADGKTMIFTSCDGRESYGKCDLYETHKRGEEWTEPTNLGSNVNTYAWESQPALSSDGRTLYFISDRKGGVGARDIYVAHKDNEGKWMPATNLGKGVNTPFDEVSPFIHGNSRTLFFASDGLPGMGGYDLFYSELENNTWGKPINLGYPINTKEDQVSLFVSADGRKGYYTFETLNTDIRLERSILAEFEMPKEAAPAYKSNYVKGEVFDAETKDKLEAQIQLYDIKTEELISSVSSDPVNGEYLIVLTEGSQYALYVRKAGYLFKSLSFNYTDTKNPEPVIINVELQKVKSGSKVILNNLFFPSAKYELEEKSKLELGKITEFLELNSKIKIEVSGHTDDVGSDDDNKALSLNRARSVYDYLIKSGISKDRMIYRGFGETQPTVPNDSEYNRQLNRRIEFKIL